MASPRLPPNKILPKDRGQLHQVSNFQIANYLFRAKSSSIFLAVSQHM